MSSWADEARDTLAVAKFETLRILVWGPGDPGVGAPPERVDAYNKRLQIRDELRKQFPRAEVFFSEDPEMQALGPPEMSQLEREALQASGANLVLMLDISRGTDLELDHFVPTYSWFRDKVYVLLPERYVPPRGLAKEVFDYIRPTQVVGYSDDEFKLSKVVRERAVNVATIIAMKKRLKGL